MCDDLELPKLNIRFHDVHLTEEERMNYNTLKDSYKAIFKQNGLLDGKRGSTSHIFQTILQLRQFCDHGLELLPQNVLEIFQDSAGRDNLLNNILSTPEACASCGRRIDQGDSDAVESKALDCDYSLCRKCRGRVEDEDLCGGGFSEGSDEAGVWQSSSPSDNHICHYTPSSKVTSLLDNLRAEREGAVLSPVKRYCMPPPLLTSPLTGHSVVFSCWTRMLDLVQKALTRNGFVFVRIDGSSSETKRRAAIEEFRSSTECHILLASVGSAGVG